MSYDIVPYRAGLRPGVMALLRYLTDGDDAVRDAYFRWKHEENPFVAAPVAYLALHGGRVVGVRAFHGACWRSPETSDTQRLLCACDLVVEPAHRGQGLHQRIMDAALVALRNEGHRIVLNFSANPVTARASLRTGWRLVAPYAMWAVETGIARFAYRAAARLAGCPGLWRFTDAPRRLMLRRDFSAIDDRWRKRGDGGGAVLALEPRPEVMASLAARMPAAGTSHVRDPAYYRWRFRNPTSEYRFAFWNDRSPTAFAVLQRPRYGHGNDIAMVDYAATDAGDLLAMIGEIVDAGGFDRMSLWTACLPQRVVDGLGALGFAPRDMSRGDRGFRHGFLAIELADGAVRSAAGSPAVALPTTWDLRMVDSDAY